MINCCGCLIEVGHLTPAGGNRGLYDEGSPGEGGMGRDGWLPSGEARDGGRRAEYPSACPPDCHRFTSNGFGLNPLQVIGDFQTHTNQAIADSMSECSGR